MATSFPSFLLHPYLEKDIEYTHHLASKANQLTRANIPMQNEEAGILGCGGGFSESHNSLVKISKSLAAIQVMDVGQLN